MNESTSKTQRDHLRTAAEAGARLRALHIERALLAERRHTTQASADADMYGGTASKVAALTSR